MIGRGAYGRPWFLQQVIHFLKTGERLPDPPLARQREILLDHYDDMLSHYGVETGVRVARKHLGWYARGFPGAAEFRNRVMKLDRPRRGACGGQRRLGRGPGRRASAGGGLSMSSAIIERLRHQFAPDIAAILGALPNAVLAIDGSDIVRYVNHAAEQFFESSAMPLDGMRLADLLPGDSPIFAILQQVRQTGTSVSEDGVTLETPRIGARFVTIHAAPLAEATRRVVVSLHERSIARKIDRQLTHRNAARSVTAMAAMLAHEVKNPLSGIRGAAQLLEQAADASRTAS